MASVSVKELAHELGVSTDTVRRAYRRGEIPAKRVGTALRFDLRRVHRAMQTRARQSVNKATPVVS